MHSAAYFYIRHYFRKNERDNVYVRFEPRLAGKKPDVVVCERGKPIYILEFKLSTKRGYINEGAVDNDLRKLAGVVDLYPSVRWRFFHMIYDADEPFTLSDSHLRRAAMTRFR